MPNIPHTHKKRNRQIYDDDNSIQLYNADQPEPLTMKKILRICDIKVNRNFNGFQYNIKHEWKRRLEFRGTLWMHVFLMLF